MTAENATNTMTSASTALRQRLTALQRMKASSAHTSAAGGLLVVAMAFLARVNVYELMFHPIQKPAFQAAREVKLDGAEKVIAVRIGAEARAYPIRGMSYHHMVNDVVGGAAIVATY